MYNANVKMENFESAISWAKKDSPAYKKYEAKITPKNKSNASENSFCSKCGSKIEGENKFCGKCGKEIGSSGGVSVSNQMNGDDLIKFLNDKFLYLGNVSHMDFQTEYAKVCLDLKAKLEAGIDADKYVNNDMISPFAIGTIVFDILLPQSHNVAIGQFSDFLGRDPLGAGIVQGLGGQQQFVNYMISLSSQVFQVFQYKQSFFKSFKKGKFLNPMVSLSEIKDKDKGKTKSRSIRFNFNGSIREFSKFYLFVIGSPNKGGSAYNDGIFDPPTSNYIDIPNVSVYGTGLAYLAIGLK